MTASPAPVTLGVHHVGLSVSDLGKAVAFFTGVLGHAKVAERPDYPAAFVSDGKTLITLWQVENPDACIAFDRRRNVGLHHMALRVADDAALDALHARLAAAGIEVEFSPEPLKSVGVRHMMCRMPGGPRLEFIAA